MQAGQLQASKSSFPELECTGTAGTRDAPALAAHSYGCVRLKNVECHGLDTAVAHAASLAAVRPVVAYARIRAAICSAIMTVVIWVLARGTSGMIDASTTRRPSTPITRPSESTTDRGSSTGPIRQVPTACT